MIYILDTADIKKSAIATNFIMLRGGLQQTLLLFLRT